MEFSPHKELREDNQSLSNTYWVVCKVVSLPLYLKTPNAKNLWAKKETVNYLASYGAPYEVLPSLRKMYSSFNVKKNNKKML